MSQYNSTITFGALTLTITRTTPIKMPGMRFQIVGRNLVSKQLPDRTTFTWQLRLEGFWNGDNRHVDRGILEGYDDVTARSLVDGIHDGEYFIMPGSLMFNDDRTSPNHYRYSFTLVEKKE